MVKRLLSASVAAAAIACAFASCTSTSDDLADDRGSTSRSDAAAPIGQASPEGGGGAGVGTGPAPPAPGAPEHAVGQPLPGCPAEPASSAGTGERAAVAVRSSSTKTIDGDLRDWRRCPAFAVNRASSARSEGDPLANAIMFVEWEPDALYVAAWIWDGTLEGSSPYLWQNDSIEIYIGGHGELVGDYRPEDHQLIVDHRGVAADHAGLSPVPHPDAKVKTYPDGYLVETRFAADSLGGKLASGNQLAIDVLLNDGLFQTRFLIWALTPHSDCKGCVLCTCNRSPAFDTLFFAPLTLRD